MSATGRDLEVLQTLARPPSRLDDNAGVGPVRVRGHDVPSDFIHLVDTYGAGAFGEFIWVLQPSAANKHLDLARHADLQLAALRQLQSEGEHIPYEIHGDDAELLPWAVTDNGDVCYWVMRPVAQPDRWTVVVNEARGPLWETFSGSATQFLVAVLSGSARFRVFPEDFPPPAPAFEPVDEDGR